MLICDWGKLRCVSSKLIYVGSGSASLWSDARRNQSNCSCFFFSYSALRVKKSQGLTNHFLNLHRSRSYIEISVRNCFIFSVGRSFFCFCEKKLGTLIGRWHLGRCFCCNENHLWKIVLCKWCYIYVNSKRKILLRGIRFAFIFYICILC